MATGRAHPALPRIKLCRNGRIGRQITLWTTPKNKTSPVLFSQYYFENLNRYSPVFLFSEKSYGVFLSFVLEYGFML
jgi:hypothetical protein